MRIQKSWFQFVNDVLGDWKLHSLVLDKCRPGSRYITSIQNNQIS